MSSYVYWLIALVPSVVLHEVSHGWVANFFGDPTAKENHRLTLNPVSHIDPFGSVLLPVLLVFSHLPPFGYAKPVPVNLSRLRNPRRQSLYVALAGPFVNILLSAVGFVICELALHVFVNNVLLNVGLYLGLVNLILAVFNLFPIPPLDGSAIIERFVPRRKLPAYYAFRARAMPIVMIVVIVGFGILHIGTGFFSGLENWWLNQLF